MPVYEYECGACEHRFEEWQKISDPPVKTCPKCKAKKVQRLISQTSFALKGGGWYSDLYASSKGTSKTEGGAGEGASASKDSPAKESGKESGGAKEATGGKDTAAKGASKESGKPAGKDSGKKAASSK